jgi:hypothetical protein
MAFQEKGIALAILGIIAVILITGLILMLTGEKTGKIVTYRNTNPNVCFSSYAEACARTLQCRGYGGVGLPVEPRPPYYPQGFAVCRCPNQIDPYSYKTILMCA